MKWGFTGTQKGISEKKILKVLRTLDLKENDWVVTGACIGVDSQIAHLVAEYYPDVRQIIIVPADRKKVDKTVFPLAKRLIKMGKGSSYRDRNKRLVEESDKVIAFWIGVKRSGAYMTIRIADREGKLHRVYKV